MNENKSFKTFLDEATKGINLQKVDVEKVMGCMAFLLGVPEQSEIRTRALSLLNAEEIKFYTAHDVAFDNLTDHLTKKHS